MEELPVYKDLDYKFSFTVDGPFSGEAMRPQGLAHTPEGDLLVVDYDQHRILRFNSSGLYQGHFGGGGNSPGCFKYPVCVQVDSSKGVIYVSDERNERVQKFSADGKFILSLGDGESPEQQLGAIFSLSVDSENQLWVADPDHNRIQIFAEDGRWLRSISGDAAGLHQPVSVHCLPGGEVIVSDRSDALLHRLDRDGKKLATIDKQGRQYCELYFLHSHPDHGIFGSDFWSQNFLRFDEDLKSATACGRPGKRNGQFGRIGGISVFEGTLAVADYDNGRVQCFQLT
jgi:DNA-binding beta-propeller fold protein YncE